MSLFNRINGRGPANSSNNSNAPVCKFFLEGRCKFGDSCKNYHPPRDSSSASGKQSLPYHLTLEGVKADLTQGDDRPTWPLSAYGPGRDAPRQLLEGEALEQSPEELRVQYYLAKSGGSTQQYEQNETSAVDQANQRAQQILNDVDGAVKYIIDGKDQHPNREDQTQKSAANFNWTSKPSFDQNAASSSGSTTFGQQSSSGFGSSSTPAFGKPAAPGFGQPSSMGSGTPFGGSGNASSSPFGGNQTSSTSAFGKPSALGVGGGAAFGQPSNLGGGSAAFGKPSALGGGTPFGGQGASNSSPFGQASANSGAPAFGQASNANASGSAFGQPSQPGGETAFGQASTPGSGTAFGKSSPFGAVASSNPAFGSSTPFGAQASNTSAFGQPSQPGQQNSPFGQAAQSSQPAQSSPFGQQSQQSQQSTPFGQSSQPAFGKPSPFGANGGGTTSTFGQSSQPAFGSSTAFGASSGNTSTFGKASTPASSTPFGGAANTSSTPFGAQPVPSPGGFSTTSNSTTAAAPGQRITTWKGQPVTYRRLEAPKGKMEDKKEYPFYRNPSTGREERIWIPDGPPAPNPDVEATPQTYEALGAALKDVYQFMQTNGVFKDGVVPEIPPKREWVGWEL